MKRLIYVLAIPVLLFACKAGKNYKGTEFIQPTSYRQADTMKIVEYDTINTDSLKLDYADVRWWELYDDPVLDTLIRQALDNNLNAMIAAENVLQARLALKIQNAEYLPKFNAGGQATRGNFLLNNLGPTSNVILGQASVSWEIDIWGKFRRLSESARAELMASEYGYRGIMISLVSEVAANYFELLRARSQFEIATRNAKSRDSMTQIIRARYEKGIAPKIDLDQALIQYTIAAGAIPQYEREIIQLENTISILLGRNPGAIETNMLLQDQNSEVDLPLETPVYLLHRRPDVVAAEYQVKSANAITGAAKANRLPSINLSALVGVAAPSFDALSLKNPLWSLGGNVLAPIFYFGQLQRQVDIQESQTFQAVYQYQNTVFAAIAEVDNLLASIRTTKQEIEIAEQRREAALNAQFLARERYDKGVTSYLEFLEQQRQALDAELLLEDLRARLLITNVQLYKALGGGWLSPEEEEQVKAAQAEENANE